MIMVRYDNGLMIERNGWMEWGKKGVVLKKVEVGRNRRRSREE